MLTNQALYAHKYQHRPAQPCDLSGPSIKATRYNAAEYNNQNGYKITTTRLN